MSQLRTRPFVRLIEHGVYSFEDKPLRGIPSEKGVRLPPSPPPFDVTPEQVRDHYAEMARQDAQDWQWFCFLMGATLIVLSVIAYIVVSALTQ